MPELWKPSEVAVLLKVDPKTVTRWAHANRMPTIRTPGGQVRIPDAAVRAMFAPEGGGRDAG